MDKRIGMENDSTIVNKKTLLDVVRQNRETHFASFERASIAYKSKLVEVIEEMLAETRKGNVVPLQINLPTPVNQTKEYDTIIRKLEMSIEETVDLDNVQFSNYVMDDWSWSRMAASSNDINAISNYKNY